jgi:hypothetical protein
MVANGSGSTRPRPNPAKTPSPAAAAARRVGDGGRELTAIPRHSGPDQGSPAHAMQSSPQSGASNIRRISKQILAVFILKENVIIRNNYNALSS